MMSNKIEERIRKMSTNPEERYRRISAADPPNRNRKVSAGKKGRKQSVYIMQQISQYSPYDNEKRKQPSFGICFDVDGVLARGTMGIPTSPKALSKLADDRGYLKIPVAFVTNSLNKNIDRANMLSGICGIHVGIPNLIQSCGPLEIFTDLHEKLCLVVGQGKLVEIAQELGFKKPCTIEDVSEAYPLLDMVDHDNRKKIALHGYVEKEFPRIEAIVLLGEPKRWESSLQLLVDLLRTDGKPNNPCPKPPKTHIPVIACNMDLQFMERAAMPRYGHGAFLVCLEALYKKCTGNEMIYTALVGKPSEITYRFAEQVLTREARKLGYTEPIKHMYLVGDCPEVDIVGCNLYQQYIDRLKARRENCPKDADAETIKEIERYDPTIPLARNIPKSAKFFQQTVDRCEGLLVCTGVHRKGMKLGGDDPDECGYKGHRDFPANLNLQIPTKIFDEVNASVEYILEKEGYNKDS